MKLAILHPAIYNLHVGSETRQGKQIRQFAIKTASFYPVDLVARIGRKFGITRQAASAHVRKLIAQGLLHKVGRTRDSAYLLTSLDEASHSFPLPGSPDESTVYTRYIRPRLTVPPNIEKILSYGFSEMFNNALDHSEGAAITVGFRRTAAGTILSVSDDGVGIFNKIARAFGLSEPRESILELSKGKLTTDETRHTGQGIFFTSRLMDKFAILSDRLMFTHDSVFEDWLIEKETGGTGTTVYMEILNDTARSLQDVFDRFSTDPDTLDFDRTQVPLTLAQYDHLVSRSQARRVLSRFEKFREVILDFKGVTSIGQAFADEIFRVYARTTGSTPLRYLNASASIERAIKRAQSSARQEAEAWRAISDAERELASHRVSEAVFTITTAGGQLVILRWEPSSDRRSGTITVRTGLYPVPLAEASVDLRSLVTPHLRSFINHVMTMHKLGSEPGGTPDTGQRGQ